ncbi:sigma factor-like helix-turn-helix DNA-binding protein [Micromonospora sp. L31]|uniref:sigma factor-like helix-turn-helix DNA-binding protein n=1 Tax=Micromonospora TaxID=1873 RepID=UPI003F8C9277
MERRRLRDLALLTDPEPPTGTEEDVVDDRLRLVFTCCHPALALEARVALTLRTVAGVPTADIARAFLVSESTMTRRITRAKTRIATAGIPYRVPTGPALVERLPGVLAVLYLLFTRSRPGSPPRTPPPRPPPTPTGPPSPAATTSWPGSGPPR